MCVTCPRRNRTSARIWQLNAIWVLPVAFVLLRKNLFKPVCLSLSHCLVHEGRMVKDNELLTTAVTPKSTHFFESWCPLSRLTLLDRHCLHGLID